MSVASSPGVSEGKFFKLSSFPPPGLDNNSSNQLRSGYSPVETPKLLGESQRTHSSSSLRERLGRPAKRGEPAWFPLPVPIDQQASEALSGVGLFSPPISRSTTPSEELTQEQASIGSSERVSGQPKSQESTPAKPSDSSGSVLPGGRGYYPAPSMLSVLDDSRTSAPDHLPSKELGPKW